MTRAKCGGSRDAERSRGALVSKGGRPRSESALARLEKGSVLRPHARFARVTLQSVESIVTALNAAKVRFLVVGGLAVAAHGYLRFTADVDLVLDPDPGTLKRAIEALATLGYRPRAPVAFEEFADPARRRAWQEEKGMTVFSLQSPSHSLTELDLFLEPPFDFERAYADAIRQGVGAGEVATFVSRSDLIAMKRAAGRPQDRIDVDELERGER